MGEVDLLPFLLQQRLWQVRAERRRAIFGQRIDPSHLTRKTAARCAGRKVRHSSDSPSRCRIRCDYGSRRACRSSQASPTRRPRFVTRRHVGLRSTRGIEDEHIEIDDSAAKCSLRRVALDRENCQCGTTRSHWNLGIAFVRPSILALRVRGSVRRF